MGRDVEMEAEIGKWLGQEAAAARHTDAAHKIFFPTFHFL